MINLKSEKEIAIMRETGKNLARIMKELKRKVKPGITTQSLEKLARTLIKKAGGKPSFLNFEGYPAALCTSLNEEIVHVVPSGRELKKGDILSLDLGVFWKGYHSDMALTVPVGEISEEKKKLVFATKEALKIGIEKSRVGNTIGDISSAIQQYVEGKGFNVVRELCGHGIGKELHEDPQILNFGKKGSGPKIREGMVFCLEPMVTIGNCRLAKKAGRPNGRASRLWRGSLRATPLAGKVKKTKDGYGYKTADDSLSAHFEHMIAVRKNGPEVLTNLDNSL